MKDRIEINSRYYSIETDIDIGNGDICSKIYLEKSGEKRLLAKELKKAIDTEPIETIQRNQHQQILATFFNMMKKNTHLREDEFSRVLQQELTIHANVQNKKNNSDVEIHKKPKHEEWQIFCKTYLPKSAHAAFMQSEGSLKEYSAEEYDASDDKQAVVSLKKYLITNRQKIIRIVGAFKILTYTTASKHYFIFTASSESLISVVMPVGKMGIYIKEIEQFRKKVLSSFI